MVKIKNKINNLIESLSSEAHSGPRISRVVFLLFAIIAFVMSILNVITHKTVLLIATVVFCLLCLLDWLLVYKSEKNNKLAISIFAVEMGFLFTYFIITGGTDNFSIIWLLMLPSLGLFFFGTTGGSILSATMLVIMVVCFRLPALQDIVTDYNETFRTRFPLVYVACFIISFMLEAVRRYTAKNLREARERYKFLSNHDPLTGLLTRGGADEFFAEICNGYDTIGIAMFDIDHFRDFNTIYGHAGGDTVLKFISGMIKEIALEEKAKAYRWGGEEFLVLYPAGNKAADNAFKINKEVAKRTFEINGETLSVTISGGVYEVNVTKARNSGFTSVIEIADNNLYKAKNTGRNKIVASKD